MVGDVTCWARHRSPERVHLWREFLIRRQGNLIDEVLDIAKGLRIERRDSPHKAIDEAFEFDVGNGAIDIAIPFGKCAIEVLTAEQDLEGPTPADETRQSGCWAASRNGAETDFHLTEHGPLSTCEADVASENELAAGAASSPSDRRDRDRWQFTQPNQQIDPRMETGRSWR